MIRMAACSIRWAVFDYGGVLAEEGFVAGLYSIADKSDLERDHVFRTAREIILATGYLIGKTDEQTFWREFIKETGIQRSRQELRNEILSRFVLRPWMVELVKGLQGMGVNPAVLSDQVNWLDELEARDDFFKYFDHVFNSYHLGKSKDDPTIFDDLVRWINARPEEVLFIDDHLPHVQRALSRGVNAVLFTGQRELLNDISRYCPGMAEFPRNG